MTTLKGVLVVALLVLVGGGNRAEGANIAYIRYGGNVSYLVGFGNSVTYLTNPIGLTLASLSGFDAVVVASDLPFAEPANIGNVLAAYADAGGGVVLAEFVFQGMFALGGQIMTANYAPLTTDPLNGGFVIASNLGTVFDPGSDLLDGVNLGTLSTDGPGRRGRAAWSDLVANWSSGRAAIAYRPLANSTIVALNLNPSSVYADVDAQRLVANALAFSQNGATVVPEPTPLLLLGTALSGLALRLRRRAS